MKIESYAVNAAASSSSIRFTSNLVQIERQALPEAEPDALALLASGDGDSLDLSEVGKKFIEQLKQMRQDAERRMAEAPCPPKVSELRIPKVKDPSELKMTMLDLLLYALTGRRFRSQPAKVESPSSGVSPDVEAQMANVARQQQTQASRGVTMRAESMVYEREQVSYSATGVVNTSDGKSISFDINLSMSREFASHSSVTMAMSRPMDPLVVNYSGSAASLTERKYQFDLDSDGAMDSMSFAGQGSGFLALDRNGDGVINDGSELFGPQSGSGFDDLRAFDGDKNGGIDENDRVYSKLRVWSRDENGNDQLFTLKELDIGAIFLGDVATTFSVNDMNNNTLGQVRSTSFFLRDSGGAGAIQHIDLMT